MGGVAPCRPFGEARRRAVTRTRRGRRLRPSDEARRRRAHADPPARPRRGDVDGHGRLPSWWSGPGVPVEWARQTMAHLCSVYPFHADAGFGTRGVLLGANVTGGFAGFFFDP